MGGGSSILSSSERAGGQQQPGTRHRQPPDMRCDEIPGPSKGCPMDYSTLPIGFQTGHPLEGAGMGSFLLFYLPEFYFEPIISHF